MTEAEAFEMALMASSNTVTTFTVYITFTFAYLIASFTAGARLTALQAFIASTLYVFSVLSTSLNTFSDLQYFKIAISHATNLTPPGAVNSADFWIAYLSVLQGAGIIASLYFMWSVRHPKKE
jgi:hypothetical protein